MTAWQLSFVACSETYCAPRTLSPPPRRGDIGTTPLCSEKELAGHLSSDCLINYVTQYIDANLAFYISCLCGCGYTVNGPECSYWNKCSSTGDRLFITITFSPHSTMPF